MTYLITVIAYLLGSIWIKDKMIIGVIPQPEFIPFFDLQYDGKSKYTIEVATPGGFEPPISTVTGWHVCPLHHGAILVQ